MKTLLRTLLYLALIVWLGAEIFFPVVAAITFTTLQPDTHTAGTIVGQLLRILHGMGLVSGMVALALLALAPAWNIYKPRAVLAPMAPGLLMIGLTVLLAVRNHPRHGARPHRRRRRHRHADATDQPRIATSTSSTTAASMLKRPSCCSGLATVVLVARAESREEVKCLEIRKAVRHASRRYAFRSSLLLYHRRGPRVRNSILTGPQ